MPAVVVDGPRVVDGGPAVVEDLTAVVVDCSNVGDGPAVGVEDIREVGGHSVGVTGIMIAVVVNVPAVVDFPAVVEDLTVAVVAMCESTQRILDVVVDGPAVVVVDGPAGVVVDVAGVADFPTLAISPVLVMCPPLKSGQIEQSSLLGSYPPLL